MKAFAKFATAALLTGVVAVAAATPGEARDGRNAAAAIGFGAGALVGAAAVSAANNGYYGSGYYDPGYAYEPAYAGDSYAYEPGYDTYAYTPRYRSGWGQSCGNGGPGQTGYTPCGNK